MNFPRLLSASFLLAGVPLLAQGKPNNYLEKCWAKQGAGLDSRYAAFSYREQTQELEHSQYPWQATPYSKKGTAWLSGTRFLRQDTVTQGQKIYYSKTQVGPDEVLYLDYGDQEPAKTVTPALRTTQLLAAARYAPLLLLGQLRQRQAPPQGPAVAGLVEYQMRLPEAMVRVFIRQQDALVERVEVLSSDELFGDVRTTFNYRDYARSGPLHYARTIGIDKLNGRLHESVAVVSCATVAAAPALLTPPVGYQLQAAPPPPAPLVVQHFRPQLHFIELKHTDDRVLVVEFEDFLVVAEAPLTSENGEAILAEARRLAPRKPVRYFVFGHYHPHYLGGLRPFVRHGATILGGPGTAEYVRTLATAPRTLHPDSLHLAPRPLQFEEVATSKTITDGRFTMQIHFIGAKSAHTNDYLIYYFPSEKLLFEDDLVWIGQKGPARKASARQAGLYQAVQDLKLDVQTVVQSWPVADYGVKTIIPFTDLEQAMQVK